MGSRRDFSHVQRMLLDFAPAIGIGGLVATVQHYVDHDEYGLALDAIGYDMYAAGRQPSQAEITTFMNVARSMSDDKPGAPEAWLADAQSRARSG